MNAVEIKAGDGTVEFICEDCERNIISVGYHDGVPVCNVCRFIRTVPEMPKEIKAALRGEDLE